MKKLLKHFYGSSIRSVMCINTICAMLWFILVFFPLIGIESINVPEQLHKTFPVINTGSALILFFAFLAFKVETSHRKQLFKATSLIIGSMLQAILGSFYISNYPPFEPMLIVCCMLSIWFIGAFLYVFEIEGWYGIHRNTD